MWQRNAFNQAETTFIFPHSENQLFKKIIFKYIKY